MMTNATLINKARAYCEQRNVRFTPLREKVYDILLGKHGPMGAYELLDCLKETETSAKPATVYRALDFLLVLLIGYEWIPRHLSDFTHVGTRFHGFAGEPRDAFVYLGFV